MRLFDKHKIAYTSHFYEADEAVAGREVAAVLGQNPQQVCVCCPGDAGAEFKKGSGSCRREKDRDD